MIPNFDQNDPGLMRVKWGLASVSRAASILSKIASTYKGQRAIPNNIPVTIPHTVFYGPQGTGKTMRVEAIASMLGCTPERGTLIRLNAECIKSCDELALMLSNNLSWKGYLCSNGCIDHSGCIDKTGTRTCKIIDPINIRGPIDHTIVFIDEIHVLSKDIQENIGLILLDFRYQYKDKVTGEVRNIFLPKFSCFAATTVFGDLLTPLQSRFGNQIEIPYYTDEQMCDIVKSMAAQKGWILDPSIVEMVAQCSQGVARAAENHLRGLYEAFCYYNKQTPNMSSVEKNVYFSKELMLKYLKVSKYLPDGMKYMQIRVLQFLRARGRNLKTEQWKFLGEQAICDNLGTDKEFYRKNIEPRLLLKGYIERGGRGRALTNKGLTYLKEIEAEHSEELS